MTATTKVPSNDLSSFRALHDRSVIVPTKVKAAFVRMLAEHPEKWLYEQAFMKEAGLAQVDMAHARSEFEAHVVDTKGNNAKRAWFANVKVAEKARESVA